MRNEIIEKVSNQKNIYKKKENVYVLKHTHDIEPTPVIVKSNLNSNTMDLLVAFLQFKADGLRHAYSFHQVDMSTFLVKHFKCELMNSCEGRYFEIDLYENWERWAGVATDVEAIGHFQNEALLEELKTLVEEEI